MIKNFIIFAEDKLQISYNQQKNEIQIEKH